MTGRMFVEKKLRRSLKVISVLGQAREEEILNHEPKHHLRKQPKSTLSMVCGGEVCVWMRMLVEVSCRKMPSS